MNAVVYVYDMKHGAGLVASNIDSRGMLIIVVFYSSDPFSLCLVYDHFSCKYIPRIKDACMLEANVKVQVLSFCLLLSDNKALTSKLHAVGGYPCCKPSAVASR